MNIVVSYRFFPPKFLQSKGALSLSLPSDKVEIFLATYPILMGYGAHMHILNLDRSFLIQRYDLFFSFFPSHLSFLSSFNPLPPCCTKSKALRSQIEHRTWCHRTEEHQRLDGRCSCCIPQSCVVGCSCCIAWQHIRQDLAS
jgi:hypothetical protein